MDNKTSLQSVNDITCKSCGSSAVSVWLHNGRCRIRCGYCNADTGEQSSLETAERIWNSFKHIDRKNSTGSKEATHVLSIDELLDISCFADDVRPVWFENRGLFVAPALLECGIAERELNIVRIECHNFNGAHTYDVANYGSWWRCWSDKPSIVQCDGTDWT